MNLQSIYVSWVDLFAVIILMVGFRTGQKRGLSQEVLVLVQWLAIIAVAGFSYQPLGQLLAAHSVFGLLFCYVTAYVTAAMAVKLFFSFIRRRVGEKLVESDVFGRGEYYLGMMAGGFRFACILVVLFSLLNARHFTRAELAAKSNYQKVNFGAVFFPSLADLQKEVFERSFSGQFSQMYLSTVLIRPTPSESKKVTRSSIVRARERDVNEVLEK